MTVTDPVSSKPLHAADVAALLARWLLGVAFIYMGLNKALHPVEFLKMVRRSEVIHNSLLLNLVASTLPWFEIFCGLLLVLGIAIRSAAVLLVAMLVPFSVLVFMRALALHETGGLPFCAIKFDCGCGTGEVIICQKLAANTFLTALSAWLIFRPNNILVLRQNLLTTDA